MLNDKTNPCFAISSLCNLGGAFWLGDTANGKPIHASVNVSHSKVDKVLLSLECILGRWVAGFKRITGSFTVKLNDDTKQHCHKICVVQDNFERRW